MIECKMCKLHVSHKGGFCNGKKEVCSQIYNNLDIKAQGTTSNTYFYRIEFGKTKVKK